MPVIETSDLRKEFGRLVAVNNVSFSVEAGQVVGLIGPNGAGKTTLLRVLATLMDPTDGNAQILGHDIRFDRLNIRRKIGYLPDFFNLYSDLTLRECLDFLARAYDMNPFEIQDKVEHALEFVELVDKGDDLVRHLSRGMVQRLGLAALMVHEPDLFLLDEPASGLDPKARIQLRTILSHLSREGRTIVISSHILTELSGFCTHIALMHNGRLAVFGSVADIERRTMIARRVSIGLLGEAERARKILETSPDVHVLQSTADGFTIEAPGAPDELAAINTRLVQAGVRVVRFCEEKTGLEELFLKISAQVESADQLEKKA